jgi:hypothetical protein
MTEAEQVQASHMDVVHQSYVRTADENYITARWCDPSEFEDAPNSIARVVFQKSALDFRILDPLKSKNPNAVAIALQVAD